MGQMCTTHSSQQTSPGRPSSDTRRLIILYWLSLLVSCMSATCALTITRWSESAPSYMILPLCDQIIWNPRDASLCSCLQKAPPVLAEGTWEPTKALYRKSSKTTSGTWGAGSGLESGGSVTWLFCALCASVISSQSHTPQDQPPSAQMGPQKALFNPLRLGPFFGIRYQ